MSANFEYKPNKDTTLDDAQQALEELRAEAGVSTEEVKSELATVGGSAEQVNEDYQLEDTLNGTVTKNETTDSDLEVMFGFDWDGSFTDMTGFVETVAQDMASQMQYNSSLTNYLSNNKTQLIDDLSRRCGLAAIKEQNTQIQNNFTALTSGFSNFKTFGFSSGSGDLLGSADSALQNVENIITHTNNLAEYTEDIIQNIQAAPEAIGEIGTYIEGKFDEISNTLANIDTSNLLSQFPSQIVDKFLGTDAVQNLFELPKRTFESVQNVVLALSTVEAPDNAQSLLAMVGTLKSAVAQMRDVREKVRQGASALEGMKNNLSNGNYIGVFLNARDAAKFIEKPTSYAAKYPFNLAYQTEGGHTFEVDNTPGKERLHTQHKSGTDFEISPKGDLVTKIKKDFQTIVESNMESHVKGNQTVIVDKTIDFESKALNLTAKDMAQVSAPNANLVIDNANILTKLLNILSSDKITIAGTNSISLSAQQPIYLNSKTGIFIDAPQIQIGSPKNMLISLHSGGSLTEKSGTHVIDSGMIRANGGLITLN